MVRIFGNIPGFVEGQIFSSRRELHDLGLHKPTQKGISGSEKEGADSIVLSGEYEDDDDQGDVIFYTGEGGRDLNSGAQMEDQKLERGNAALALNISNGLPVRVFKKSEKGYLYRGLYNVKTCCMEKGKSGFIVFRFKLEKIV